jgi:hypothetical protein
MAAAYSVFTLDTRLILYNAGDQLRGLTVSGFRAHHKSLDERRNVSFVDVSVLCSIETSDLCDNILRIATVYASDTTCAPPVH